MTWDSSSVGFQKRLTIHILLLNISSGYAPLKTWECLNLSTSHHDKGDDENGGTDRIGKRADTMPDDDVLGDGLAKNLDAQCEDGPTSGRGNGGRQDPRESPSMA